MHRNKHDIYSDIILTCAAHMRWTVARDTALMCRDAGRGEGDDGNEEEAGDENGDGNVFVVDSCEERDGEVALAEEHEGEDGDDGKESNSPSPLPSSTLLRFSLLLSSSSSSFSGCRRLVASAGDEQEAEAEEDAAPNDGEEGCDTDGNSEEEAEEEEEVFSSFFSVSSCANALSAAANMMETLSLASKCEGVSPFQNSLL